MAGYALKPMLESGANHNLHNRRFEEINQDLETTVKLTGNHMHFCKTKVSVNLSLAVKKCVKKLLDTMPDY